MKITLTRAILITVFSFLLLFSGRPAFGQLKEIRNLVPKDVPISIEIKNHDSREWVNDLEIVVTNTGEKPIYHLLLFLVLDVKAPGGEQRGFHFIYGNKKFVSADELAEEEDSSILPNEKYVFRIRKESVKGWNHRKALGNFPEPRVAELKLGWLSFGDGSGIKPGGAPYKKKSPIEGGLSYDDSKENKSPAKLQDRFFSPRDPSSSCAAKSSKPYLTNIIKGLTQVDFSPLFPELDCFDCDTGSCPSGPSGSSGPYWTKVVYERLCNHCYDYDLPTYASSGNCYDPTYGCFFSNTIIEECQAGDPPYTSSCTYNVLTACQPENCVDADGDGYYSDQIGPCYQGPFDCRDDVITIHPGATENCEYGTPDENCNGELNCEEENCRISYGSECDDQCDADSDGYYSIPCAGQDCHDDFLAEPNASNIYPGHAVENTWALCSDGDNNDCDWAIDDQDPDCAPFYQPPAAPGGCNGAQSYSLYPTTGCAPGFNLYGGSYCTRSPTFIYNCDEFGGYDESACSCYGGCWGPGCSPVAVDILGNGFQMTSAVNGVLFDLAASGTPVQYGWTAPGSDDAWLALDRNANGTIDNGRELFGNVTSQPPPPPGEEMQGFLALAQYDTAAYGGNGDGKITKHDTIFDYLRLWQDFNHNGISEPGELSKLPQLGLRRIDLDYRMSNRVDVFGNQFRFRAKVRDSRDAQLGRWAWDVYPVSLP